MTAFYLLRYKDQDEGILETMVEHYKMSQIKVGAKSTPLIFHHSMDIKESLSSLEPTAAELAKVLPNKVVAKMLSVDPRSIPAWRAHYARGSYTTPPVLSMRSGAHGFDPFVRCNPEHPVGVLGPIQNLKLPFSAVSSTT